MKRKRLILFSILLAAFLVSLPGCGVVTGVETAPPDDTVTPAVTEPATPTPTPAYRATGDGVFSLRYDPDTDLNPYTGASPTNQLVASLLYEGLFALDSSFTAQPVLCASYSTGDGVTYTFTLKSGVTFTDGSALDAHDAVYSLQKARESDRFAPRLADIEDVEALDASSFTVTLATANYRLPELLDIPIIRDGSAGDSTPPGTGPYRLAKDDSGDPELLAYDGYRDFTLLPIAAIQLVACTDQALPDLFAEQKIDLYTDDPNGVGQVNVRNDHEVRYYNTSILQFIGLNPRTSAMKNAQFRQALYYAVDRDAIVDTVMGGRALPAPLALSPAVTGYDSSWEPAVSDRLTRLSALLSACGMEDSDSDGYLEYPTSSGGFTALKLNFIVNGDNASKVAAAQSLVDTLTGVGLDITLTKLSWADFNTALNQGNYDLYYGAAQLPADFDLSALVLPGGALNYGGMGGTGYAPLLSNFLSAAGSGARGLAMRQLCVQILSNVPFIPVLYQQGAVHSGDGVVTGLAPTQSGVFYNITNIKINPGA